MTAFTMDQLQEQPHTRETEMMKGSVRYGSVAENPIMTSTSVFSDAEINKFLSDQGFPTSAATAEPVINAEVIALSNKDLRLRVLQEKANRRNAMLVLLLVTMSIGLVLAISGRFKALYVWMVPMVVIQSNLFGIASICLIAECGLRCEFTELVDNDGCATVLQAVTKRHRGLVSHTTYHLLVRYQVQGQGYIKILHVAKAEHDWTRPGDVVTPLWYIPSKPKSAVVVHSWHQPCRRRVMLASAMCTLLHFVSLALWIVQVEKKSNDGDSGMSQSEDDDDDAWFFLFLTLGMMLIGFIVWIAKIFALFGFNRLEDYVTIHVATSATAIEEPSLPVARLVREQEGNKNEAESFEEQIMPV